MKVFCPEHKKGFFAPRQSPIKCENRGHVLGELNLAGEATAEVELRWQYCCNCEHFCPISSQQENMERCPVCTRRTSTLYICDRCSTISFESDTPLETKNFRLTAEGLPQPYCPGCLQETSGEVREHVCDEMGASFMTALSICPICRERLDIGPTFPSLVAKYLRRTQSANKVTATFDYDTGLFVHVDDGEFVIITNGMSSTEALLPRVERFTDPREFYEIYQDYYHHQSPLRAGELRIHEPALVERTANGWQFQSPGILEVVVDQPKLKQQRKIRAGEVEAPAPAKDVAPQAARPSRKARRPDVVTAPREQAAPPVAMETEKAAGGKVCSDCGSVVEDRYAFCWHCGNPMKSAAAEVQAKPVQPSRRLIIEMDDASTQGGRRVGAR